ncbi:86c9ad95-6d92-476b-a8b8-d092071b7d5e [Thermothielavioides terrestris]|uniref:86c9ad95-6d92-476b-a8b8-d092071b7d5e n=1 Tax=Thermothielavioides terrestris TaxID=2587410 RepID=A0A3S4B0R9_9PEZI|nr:86c9ad95-6d92-476b-a8b8-d092071b7d5e [Thermothielavioides terrestris]
MGHDIVTTVNYYDDPGDGSPPLPVYVGSTQVTNKRPTVPVTVKVTDVSGQEANFTLDNHGFQYLNHTSAEKGFHDDATIRSHYYPECEQLLKDVTGASRVIIFGHQVRRGPADWHRISANNTRVRGPLHRAHVDQSYDGAVIRLREQFPDPEEAAAVMQRRWQIINIWRPIKPIHRSPLAVADATSVAEADLVPAAIVYRTGTGAGERRQESWTVRPSAAHRWYFKHGQRPDEVLLLKCFDSVADGRVVKARRAVHCAVEYPGDDGDQGQQEEKGNRESVE